MVAHHGGATQRRQHRFGNFTGADRSISFAHEEPSVVLAEARSWEFAILLAEGGTG